jgi:hypothetical protein
VEGPVVSETHWRTIVTIGAAEQCHSRDIASFRVPAFNSPLVAQAQKYSTPEWRVSLPTIAGTKAFQAGLLAQTGF